ncbi:MAG: hypothetical protein JWM89_2177 [Acidimicrobiales bacterium]|nr:hypothetical protein [Acidimicrobiales bacterium]
MTDTDQTVIRHHLIVDSPIERAFTTFTEQFGDFKPPEHNLLTAPISETVFEPRVGGHIVDRAVDGTECRWARILADPPDRVVFSWDISPSWRIEDDLEHTSEVEVRFTAERRSARGSNWCTGTSIGTDRAGTVSATASTATLAGRSTSAGTPPCSATPGSGLPIVVNTEVGRFGR